MSSNIRLQQIMVSWWELPPPLVESRLAGRSGPRSTHGYEACASRSPDRLTRMPPNTRRVGGIAYAIQFPRRDSIIASQSAHARVGQASRFPQRHAQRHPAGNGRLDEHSVRSRWWSDGRAGGRPSSRSRRVSLHARRRRMISVRLVPKLDFPVQGDAQLQQQS